MAKSRVAPRLAAILESGGAEDATMDDLLAVTVELVARKQALVSATQALAKAQAALDDAEAGVLVAERARHNLAERLAAPPE